MRSAPQSVAGKTTQDEGHSAPDVVVSRATASGGAHARLRPHPWRRPATYSLGVTYRRAAQSTDCEARSASSAALDARAGGGPLVLGAFPLRL